VTQVSLNESWQIIVSEFKANTRHVGVFQIGAGIVDAAKVKNPP